MNSTPAPWPRPRDLATPLAQPRPHTPTASPLAPVATPPRGIPCPAQHRERPRHVYACVRACVTSGGGPRKWRGVPLLCGGAGGERGVRCPGPGRGNGGAGAELRGTAGYTGPGRAACPPLGSGGRAEGPPGAAGACSLRSERGLGGTSGWWFVKRGACVNGLWERWGRTGSPGLC